MNFSRLKTIFTKPISDWSVGDFPAGRLLLVGGGLSFAGTFLGYGLGLALLPLPFDYGNLPGYEGVGLFWGMLGILVAGLLSIMIVVRDAKVRLRVHATFLQFWAAMLIVQHAQAVWSFDTGPWLSIFVPIVAATGTGVAQTRFSAERLRLFGFASAGVALALAAGGIVGTVIYHPNFGVPSPNPVSDVTLESHEVTSHSLRVVAAREDARATIIIDPADNIILRRLYLAPRYDTYFGIKDRRGWEFTSSDGGAMMDLRLSQDEMNADILLALDTVDLLQHDEEVNGLYRYELAQIHYRLEDIARSAGAVHGSITKGVGTMSSGSTANGAAGGLTDDEREGALANGLNEGPLREYEHDALLRYGLAVFGSRDGSMFYFVLPPGGNTPDDRNKVRYVWLAQQHSNYDVRFSSEGMYTYRRGQGILAFDFDANSFESIPFVPVSDGLVAPTVIDAYPAQGKVFSIVCDLKSGTHVEDCSLQSYEGATSMAKIIAPMPVVDELYESMRLADYDPDRGVLVVETLGGEGPAGFGRQYEVNVRTGKTRTTASYGGVGTCHPDSDISASCSEEERQAAADFEVWRKQWKQKFDIEKMEAPYSCGATTVVEGFPDAVFLGCLSYPRGAETSTVMDKYTKLEYDYPAFWGEPDITTSGWEVLHSFPGLSTVLLGGIDHDQEMPGRGAAWFEEGARVTGAAWIEHACDGREDCRVFTNKHGVRIAEMKGIIGTFGGDSSVPTSQYFIYSPDAVYSGITISAVRTHLHEHDTEIEDDIAALVNSIRFHE